MEYLNDTQRMDVAEKLYYHINPETKMDVPSSIYQITETWYKQYQTTNSELDFFNWCLQNKN